MKYKNQEKKSFKNKNKEIFNDSYNSEISLVLCESKESFYVGQNSKTPSKVSLTDSVQNRYLDTRSRRLREGSFKKSKNNDSPDRFLVDESFYQKHKTLDSKDFD